MSPTLVGWVIALVIGISVDAFFTKLKFPGWLATVIGLGVFIGFGLLFSGVVAAAHT